MVSSPPVSRKTHYAKEVSSDQLRGQSEADSHCHEVRPIPAAQLRQAHLQPQSASAPSSPRLGLRRPPQQITVTSSATLKVTQPNNLTPPGRGATTSTSATTSRDRSKSPAVNR